VAARHEYDIDVCIETNRARYRSNARRHARRREPCNFFPVSAALGQKPFLGNGRLMTAQQPRRERHLSLQWLSIFIF